MTGGDPCAPHRELASARLDGALSPPEAAALAAHLGGCAPCRAHAARLARVVGAVRGAGPLVVLGEEELAARLAALGRRLAAAGDAPGGLADDASEAPVDLADDELEDAPDDEVPPAPAVAPPVPAVAPARPAGGGIDWVATARASLGGALALLFVVGAALLLRARLASLDAPHPPRPVSATERPRLVTEAPPVTEAPRPATEAPPQGTTEVTTATRSTRDPGEVPPIAPPPSTEPFIVRPLPPTPPAPDGTRGRDAPPGPPDDEPVIAAAAPASRPRPPVDRDALARLLRQLEDPATPTDVRVANVEQLGDLRFDDERTTRALAAILQGALDRFPGANEVRRAACVALGSLGSVEATAVLLAAPLREAHRDADAAALLDGLLALGPWADTAPAVALVADGLASRASERDDERRLVAIEALARLARVEAGPGLAAVAGARGLPRGTRREAAAALGATGWSGGREPLTAALAAREPEVRQGAARGLGALAARLPRAGADACVAALGRALADREVPVALAAARGLSASGRPEAVPVLVARVDAADEPRGAVRAAAREALLRLTGQAHATAAAWRAWWAGGPPLPAYGSVVAEVSDEAAFFRLPAQGDGVAFLLDHSGSMDGKWDLATFELRRALTALPERVRMAVWLFADTAQTFTPGLVPATRTTVGEALAWVQTQGKPRAARLTEIGPPLLRALALPGVDTVYLVTDGADSRQDLRALRRALARANGERTAPARIHCVLIRAGGAPVRLDDRPGDPSEPPEVAFMRGVARDSGGIFARN